MAHGDAIGDGDGGEFARGALFGMHANFHSLRLTVQRDVTGGSFVPAGGDAHQRLVNLFFGHAHGIVVRPVRRAGRAFGHVAAGQPGFVEAGRGGHRWAP